MYSCCDDTDFSADLLPLVIVWVAICLHLWSGLDVSEEVSVSVYDSQVNALYLF